MEKYTPDKGINRGLGVGSEFYKKVLSGELKTRQIRADELIKVCRSGLATGFRIEMIADEGSEYPSLITNRDLVEEFGKVTYSRVPKGHIAVSIAIPEGKDIGDLWDHLSGGSFKRQIAYMAEKDRKEV